MDSGCADAVVGCARLASLTLGNIMPRRPSFLASSCLPVIFLVPSASLVAAAPPPSLELAATPLASPASSAALASAAAASLAKCAASASVWTMLVV